LSNFGIARARISHVSTSAANHHGAKRADFPDGRVEPNDVVTASSNGAGAQDA
jgi:hypothetical protein